MGDMFKGNDGTNLNQSQRVWVGPYGQYTEQLIWQVDATTGELLGTKKKITV